jgi:hypothetical protein
MGAQQLVIFSEIRVEHSVKRVAGLLLLTRSTAKRLSSFRIVRQ